MKEAEEIIDLCGKMLDDYPKEVEPIKWQISTNNARILCLNHLDAFKKLATNKKVDEMLNNEIRLFGVKVEHSDVLNDETILLE